MKRLSFLIAVSLTAQTVVSPLATRLSPNQLSGFVVTERWTCLGGTSVEDCTALEAIKIKLTNGIVTGYYVTVPASSGFDPSVDPKWTKQ